MRRRTEEHPLPEHLLQVLARLSDEASRARFLARRRRLYRSSVVRALSDAAWARLRVDTHQALSLAEAAVSIARKLRNNPYYWAPFVIVGEALNTFALDA